MKKIIFALVLVSLCCAPPAGARLSEKSLSSYNHSFLSRVIKENMGDEEKIRRYLNGFLLEGNRGSRILDRFGLFLARMDKKGVELVRARFFSRNELFCFHLLMRDVRDGQSYTLYLEYEYGPGGECLLRDISFSILFEEGMTEARGFFEAR